MWPWRTSRSDTRSSVSMLVWNTCSEVPPLPNQQHMRPHYHHHHHHLHLLALPAYYAEQGLRNSMVSVRLSVPFTCHTPLLRVCCCGPSMRYRSTAAQHSAAAVPQKSAHQQMRAVPRCQLTYEAEHRPVNQADMCNVIYTNRSQERTRNAKHTT